MPIRIEHQPSPYAVGLAGWQAGRGAAKQRQQKYALDLWQQDRQNRYMEDRQDQRQQWMEQQNKQQQQFYDARDQRRLLNGRAMQLPDIPEDLANTNDRKTLTDMRIGIGKLAATIDPNNPSDMEQFEQKVLDYTDALNKAPRVSVYDKVMKDAVWLDKNNQRVEPNTPGAKPFRVDPSRGLTPLIDRSNEEAEADKAERQRIANQNAQLTAEKEAYAKAESDQKEWLTKRAAKAKEIREADRGDKPAGKRLSEEQILEQATEQMLAEGWGDMPRLPPLRPGEKPEMGIPALGPEITPITDNATGAAQTAAPATAVETLDVDPVTRQPRLVPPAPAAGTGGGIFSVEDEAVGKAPADVTQLRNTLPTPASLGIAPDPISDADKQRIRGMVAAQNQPTEYDRVQLVFQQRLQEAYAAASPTGRKAILERWPNFKPVDEMYPDEQFGIGQAATPQSTLQQHTEAQYGARRGTGEGIRSDAAGIAGRLEGAGALAGRMREPAARPTVTKYSLGPEEEQANKMAKWIKYQNAMDRLGEPKAATSSSTATQTATVGEPGLYLGAGAGTGTTVAPVSKPRRSAAAGVERFAELENRKMMAQAAKVRVRTKADYDRLRPGTYYIDPQGNIRQKQV